MDADRLYLVIVRSLVLIECRPFRESLAMLSYSVALLTLWDCKPYETHYGRINGH